jgi:hypothetical protein
MALREELMQIRQAGMEKAAEVWEFLENLPSPVDPANVYKAATSLKCAEFINRIRNHKIAPVLAKIMLQFLDDTLAIVGLDSGEVFEGARVLQIIEETMPLTPEIYNDALAYATRQHVYDGLLLLAAARLGKEVETKKRLDDMQESVAMVWLMSRLEESGIQFDPNAPPQA